MIGLLVFKEKLKQFYGKYNIYIVPVVKFLVGFLTFWLINANVGFMSKLKNPLIPVVMGLVAPYSIWSDSVSGRCFYPDPCCPGVSGDRSGHLCVRAGGDRPLLRIPAG